jgi:uncharacterized protein YcbK (DUF882 family)
MRSKQVKTMTTRRKFLKTSAAAAATMLAPAAVPRIVLAKSAPRNIQGERQLKFYNLHTGEHLKATYWVDGVYVPDEMQAINHILRDFRTGDIKKMDPHLMELLFTLQHRVDKGGAFHVISGYRSPKTNAKLHNRSSGVATHSLHMKGKAIDIRLPGVELKHLRQAALKMHAGGVGYYPKSNFVHVDTGRPRFW